MLPFYFAATAALTTITSAASISRKAASLDSICTTANVQAALPANGTLLGFDFFSSSVTANSITNSSAGASGPGGMGGGSSANYPYCNVSVTYTHPGRNDEIVVIYAFPQPSDFQNRFYVAGGGGYALSSSATGGLEYGAAGGATSAGYDAFENDYIDVALLGNGSINWDAAYAFGYVALGEMTVIGKALTTAFYGLSSDTKVYTYFEGCSDGGRQAMSQVQRWGEEYDGVVAGAPAFRYAQQQVNHVFPATVEYTLDYYPPSCALDKILNATIAACDPLDGRTDGVVSRTDLCMLNFNLTSIVGEAYYCAAASGGGSSMGGPPGSTSNTTTAGNTTTLAKRQAGGGMGSSTPEQNGTVTAQDVAVVQAIYDGLHNTAGERAYLSWQITSALADAVTQYDNTTDSYELDIPSTGGEFVTRFVQLVNTTNLSNLDNVTYDTLVQWMDTAYFRYLDSLQTTVPDLTPFQSSGGKLLHYHGESDGSVPAASSVHYWQSVRSIMYSNSSSNASIEGLQDWYQLYLVPGAGHCGANTLQPGPYPQNNMNIMIDWVENGITPTSLNATVSSGSYEGETQFLCQWPTRPLWTSNTTFDCVTDQASIDTWTYTFPAFKVPIY